MSNNMLDVSLSDIQGPIKTLLDDLCGSSGREILTELNHFNRKEPCWVKRQVKVPAKPKVLGGLLEEVGRPIMLPGVVSFVASEKFVEGATIDGVKITFLDDTFKENFRNVREEGVKPIVVQERKLLRSTTGNEVYVASGGNGSRALTRPSIALAHIWEVLKIANRGRLYLFLSHDLVVYAHWYKGGLHVGASSLGHPHVWLAGGRFVSC